ncbi:THUMP domain-containing protein [Vogesella indigofera]|uniref:THUMP domain-containing protein n=1 Tax=Vogesella indigofera TaxID=45465 RepID=UPI00234DDA4C|nr:THUMP domain-containing protein [Vogesella indigofera]MDC7703316.1 THUMP domain-containing protein [Vogesella indigofera]
MSTFRSRQRAAQRRQPTPTAERATPPAGNNAPPGPRGDKPFQQKPRAGDARQEGRFGAPRDKDPRFGNDKPRFAGDQPRDGGFNKPRFDADKPRFGGDKPREGSFQRDRDQAPREGGFNKPRFDADKPRFGGDKPREGSFQRDGGFNKPRFDDKPRFGGDKPREGGFQRDRDQAPRDGGFNKPRFDADKPRFGSDKPREGSFQRDRDQAPRDGGFNKPRFDDKPRFGGDKPRDGGFQRDQAPREGGFNKPRFDDKPRFGGDKPRDGGFQRDRDQAPRDAGFNKPRFDDKPRFGGDQPRDGSFQRDREQAPREGGFNKPRFDSDKPRFGGDKPREGSFNKPRFDDKPREGSFQRDSAPRSPAAEGQGPKVLFGNRKIEDNTPAAPASSDNAAASGERSYTRDRVAGIRGKAHPDFQASERREPAEPTRPKSFLKTPRRDDDASAPRSFPATEPREAAEPARPKSFLKSPRRDEAHDSGERAPRRDDRPYGETREGSFQRNRTFDARGDQSGVRESGFQRDRTFDRSSPARDGERKPWQQDDKPRFDRERSAPRDEQAPRTLFGKGNAPQRSDAPRGNAPQRGDAANVGRTPYAKPQARILQQGQLALFASCPRGLEKLLAEEISQQGGIDLQLTDGGVHFTGNQEVMMRVNLHSRTASRLLQQLAQGSFQIERDIYTLAKSIDWPALFDVSNTIKVKTDGHARLRSIDYVSLIVKDAICDRFRALNDERPSVDTRRPDIRIRVFLSGFDVQIYLDTSGEALFKRGWRDETGEAPLRENLAAGILLSAGYNGSQPLLDPMCGSGTFLVEAADIALNRAPGRLRSFAFEKLNTHNDLLWHSIRNDAELAVRPLEKLAIYGNDVSLEMVEIARHNLTRCGLESLVTLSHGDATALQAPAANGLLVCNPPYGVRLDEQDSLAELYPRLATWLKRNFAGWTAHLMTADNRLPALMRLNAEARPMLYNGALECRVYAFPLVAGSNRKE